MTPPTKITLTFDNGQTPIELPLMSDTLGFRRDALPMAVLVGLTGALSVFSMIRSTCSMPSVGRKTTPHRSERPG